MSAPRKQVLGNESGLVAFCAEDVGGKALGKGETERPSLDFSARTRGHRDLHFDLPGKLVVLPSGWNVI